MADIKNTQTVPSTLSSCFKSEFEYRSATNVKVEITGDIDYVLKMLSIVAIQLKAADGRLTDAA